MRWRILALLFFARIGLGLQFQTLASVGDDLVVAFGLGLAEIGVLIGLFMAPGLALALPAGFAGRYASDRALAGLGLAALAAGGALSAVAADAWTIGAGRLVAGVGFLLSTLYLAKMVADWFSGREIATAMSVLVMSWPFGIAIGQIGHAWLALNFGWRAPFEAASLYCILAAAAVVIFYRPAQAAPAQPATSAPGLGLARAEWGLILLAGLAWGAFNAGYVGYLAHGPAMLETHGYPAFEAAAVTSIGSWLMILSGTACGMLVDRTGRRGLILGLCMAAAALSLALLAVPGMGAPASLLFGLVGMAPAGAIMALAAEAVAPQRRAFGMGVFFTVYYAVMTVCPPVAGRLSDATGGAGAALGFAALLFLAVLPAAWAFGALKARA